jgi:hypothetical protein
VPQPGYSSGQAEKAIEKLLKEELPNGMTYEWTDLTYQQILSGNTALFVFPLCVLLAFLVLAAQYESWSLPLAVILIVPMTLLSAITGVIVSGGDNNIFTQIGLIVLVGLACKNAILIVEFAKDKQLEGLDPLAAVLEACRLRLRPILMTSFAFIMGVVPLVFSSGAGAEMRHAMGVAVFSGMLGVTFFGLLLTPVFYVLIRNFVERGEARKAAKAHCKSRWSRIHECESLPAESPGAGAERLCRGPGLQDPGHRGGPHHHRHRWRGQEFRPLPFRRHLVAAVRRPDPQPVGDRVAEGQPRLRVAFARWKAARAIRDDVSNDAMPTITSRASSDLAKGQIPGQTTNRVNSERYDLGLDMAWELDLFGRIQRNLEASQRRAAGGRGRSVSTASHDDCRTGGRLRSTARRATARKDRPGQPGEPAESRKITISLRDAGVGDQLDVERADARLASVEASVPQLQAEQVRQKNRIATLLGQRPDKLSVDLSPKNLPAIAKALPIGDPGSCCNVARTS